MAVTISSLKTYLYGGSRRNKFLIELTMSGVASAKLNVLCKSLSFPQRTIGVTSVWRHGRKLNLRSETEYPDTFDITVLDDNSLTIRKALDSWASRVDDSKLSGGTSNAVTSYTTDFNIWQLNALGAKVYGYTIFNAFPSTIGEVQYDDSEQNAIVEYPVTFTYSEFTPVTGDGLIDATY